ncbi:hypothetical protein IAU59_000455 [Kwoniella sp. CBS 9459]
MSATPGRRALPTSSTGSGPAPATTTIPSPKGDGGSMTVSPSSKEYLDYILSHQSSKRSRTRTRTQRARERTMIEASYSADRYGMDRGPDPKDLDLDLDIEMELRYSHPSRGVGVMMDMDEGEEVDERDLLNIWERDFELPSPVDKPKVDWPAVDTSKTSALSAPQTVASHQDDIDVAITITAKSQDLASSSRLHSRNTQLLDRTPSDGGEDDDGDDEQDTESVDADDDKKSWAWKEGMKIIGVGHQADDLPLTNSQRMQLGLPLKPPALPVPTTSTVSPALLLSSSD